ncbi:MAG: TonB-dependent receptor [Sulfurospirillum sp.]
MKCPRGFRGNYFSLAAILAFSASATLAGTTASYNDSSSNLQKQDEYTQSEEETPPQNEQPIVVISKKIKVDEARAPFASEVYTQVRIKKSHAKNLYEFLNTQTSITTLPGFGNKFSQKIDFRGYGSGNGYENIVITLDGRRLNNIDMMPQLLSSIPIDSVKRIEIIKGSGSVEYGDGANAGVINIITKKGYNGAKIKTYFGSNGVKFGSLGLGIKREKFTLSGYVDGYQGDGEKVIASDGTKDNSWNRNRAIKGTFTPIKNLTFNLGKTFSKMKLKYANALTLTQYETDVFTIPNPSWGVPYSEQYFSSDMLTYGVKYKISPKFTLTLQGSDEDKTSDFITYNSRNDYDYKSYNARLNYSDKDLKAVFGVQKFAGQRYNSTKSTDKDNLGYYAKFDYAFGKNLVSFGIRGESIKYKYTTASTNLSDRAYMEAYDLGYNYKLNSISSLFLNLNQSFQSPDIDRFFNAFTNTFNGFIKPMRVRTVNAGYNYLGYPNKLKFSAFYSYIDNEIYYNSLTWTNTNLDKTRKYGFELYDRYNFRYNLFATLNYAFVDTNIRENSSDPSIVGREIPGVSKHNVKLSLGYKPMYGVSLALTHIYKSKAYAMSDFDGSFGKMDAYNSTDLMASYKYKKFDFFVKINNLFDRKNALFADNGFSIGVYPVNYERNFMIGANAKF